MNIRIGSTYEVIKGDVMWYESDKEFIGKRCVVRSVFVTDYGIEIAAVEFSDGCCLALRAELLQVIRTPEQIEAEERDKGILQMAHDCGSWWQTETDMKCLPPVFAAMWKAGYRKSEIVEGE